MYVDVSAVCSKEGDKGKGWSVKSYMDQGSKEIYCLYNGTFRLRPQPDGNNLCPKAPKRRKYMTSFSESCANDKVHLDTYVPSRRQKYFIKPVYKKGVDYPFYNIIDKKGKECSKIYLSAPDQNDFVVDYEDPQPMRQCEHAKVEARKRLCIGQSPLDCPASYYCWAIIGFLGSTVI
jgi:hypothetical protein